MVGVAVLVGVIDAHCPAGIEADAAGALDHQKEQVDRVVDVEQGAAFQCAAAGFELGARVIGHHTLAFNAPAQALAFEIGAQVAQVDGEQVIGHAIMKHFARMHARP